MSSANQKNKKAQLDNERKKSYIEAGQKTLNQSIGGNSNILKTNASGNADNGNSAASIQSRVKPSAGVSAMNNNPGNNTQVYNQIYQQQKQQNIYYEIHGDTNMPTALEIEQFQS